MVRFITKDGKRIPIDDNRRTRSNGNNDRSNGMKIGNGTKVPKMQSTRTEQPLSTAERKLYVVEWQDERDLSNIFVMRKRDQETLFEVTEFEEARDLTEDGFIEFFGDTEGLLNHLNERGVINPDKDALIDPEFDSQVEDELGSDIDEILQENKKFNLTEIALQNGDEYFVFPTEDDALNFGRESVRDLLRPDGGEFKEDEEVIDAGTVDGKFDVEEALDFVLDREISKGGRSELGVLAEFINPVDGQFNEIDDYILFQTNEGSRF